MSTIKCTTIQNLSGVEVYTAKAWVNFNGTGTVAIRASGNVSSITDNGTGDYTVNFANAMPDVNYNVVCMGGNTNATGTYIVSGSTTLGTALLTKTVSAQQIQFTGSSGGRYDMVAAEIAIFR